MEHGDGLLAIGSCCLRWFGDGLGVMDGSGQRDGGGLLQRVAHGRGRWLIWVQMGAGSFAWRSMGIGLLAGVRWVDLAADVVAVILDGSD
ncbi:hypothetical protein ACLOJK_027452 [Asimina triloba]